MLTGHSSSTVIRTLSSLATVSTHPARTPNHQTNGNNTNNHSHFTRVVGYMRGSDYGYGAGFAAMGPATLYLMERVSPSSVGKGGFAGPMRLMGAVGLTAGFLLAYSRSISTFVPFFLDTCIQRSRSLVDSARKVEEKNDGYMNYET